MFFNVLLFQMIETKIENPWDVQSLYDYLYFNCPACSYKHNSKQDFLVHTFNIHTESEHYLRNISDGSISDVSLPWLCNEFKSHEIINDQDLKVEDDNYNDIMEINSNEISNGNDKSEETVEENTYFDPVDDEQKIELKTNTNPSVVLTEIETLHCMECDKYFTSTEKLRIHARQFHEETNSFDLELDLTSDPLQSDNQYDDDEDYETGNVKGRDSILSLVKGKPHKCN